DVLQYIRSAQIDNNAVPKAYWNNTSGNIIVKNIIEKSNYDTQQKLEALLEDKTITIELSEDLTYDSLYDNADSLWTVLYLSGYLTKSSLQPADGKLSLTIPNKKIKKIFIKTIKTWFENAMKKEDLSVLLKALWAGNAETLQEELTRILYETISYYDSAENFYHGFMAGIFTGAGLMVDSNKESGQGRPDLIVIDGPGKRAAVIELKRTSDPRQLDALAEQAWSETQTLSYAKGRIARLKSVLCYGIAFCRKDCAVSLHS
ncbi:MAG: PD-(D/E)XK nuclease domain-containing protein, partial [Desulfovibrio sp.]|nr:PD-(D/E)XK nuclease domain-containing protein [Desulfovibrio sp.]